MHFMILVEQYLKDRNFRNCNFAEICAEFVFAIEALKNLNLGEFNFAIHFNILYKFFESKLEGFYVKNKTLLDLGEFILGEYEYVKNSAKISARENF